MSEAEKSSSNNLRSGGLPHRGAISEAEKSSSNNIPPTAHPLPSQTIAGIAAAVQRIAQRVASISGEIDRTDEAARLAKLEGRFDSGLEILEGKAFQMADTPAAHLPDIVAKARILEAVNFGAITEDGAKNQTGPEALAWSIIRDLLALS